jgi:hypothetical protein
MTKTKRKHRLVIEVSTSHGITERNAMRFMNEWLLSIDLDKEPLVKGEVDIYIEKLAVKEFRAAVRHATDVEPLAPAMMKLRAGIDSLQDKVTALIDLARKSQAAIIIAVLLIGISSMASADAVNTAIIKDYSNKELKIRVSDLIEGCYLSSDCHELRAIYAELKRRGICYGPRTAETPHTMWDYHKCGLGVYDR